MRKISGLFVFMFTILFIAACSSEPAPNEGEESAANEAGEASGGDVVVDLVSEPVSLDPHAANDGNSLYVMSTIYDTLVYLDEDLKVQPGLAESLEQIEDTVWEAKIRQGVTFHDDSELNAEVIKANLDRVRDPDLGSPLAFLFDMIDEVEVKDDYTVHIKTKFPFAALPSHLAHPAGHMISLESIKADEEAVNNGRSRSHRSMKIPSEPDISNLRSVRTATM